MNLIDRKTKNIYTNTLRKLNLDFQLTEKDKKVIQYAATDQLANDPASTLRYMMPLMADLINKGIRHWYI